jgi:hypothetical protein
MSLTLKQRWTRLTHWEYWPMWTIYLPLGPYYFFESFRSGGFGFFTRTNPSMQTGGMGLMDKEDMYNLLPEGSFPTTSYFNSETEFTSIQKWISTKNIQFPIVVKPAKGCRGRGVEFIHSEKELQQLVLNCREKMVIQSLIPFRNEVGIFYVRIPGKSRGRITGIVEKKGIEITGDGIHSITELVMQSERYALHIIHLKKDCSLDLNEILPSGKTKELSSIGNHSRGATFFDVTFRNSEHLERVFDSISNQIQGYYYGRFDVKFESWELLEKGESFSIVELNGANSEPTHVYDPNHSYFFALNEFKKHYKIMAEISRKNKNLCPTMPWKKAFQLFNDL